MLLTTTCLDDQTVAEKMRTLAGLRTSSAAIIELAVDEAVWTYQHGGDTRAAIDAGLDALNEALAERESSAPAGAVERACRRLLESGWFLAGLIGAGMAITLARANGWLP